MNKGSIVERLCSDLIAKSRDINGLLYFYLTPPPAQTAPRPAPQLQTTSDAPGAPPGLPPAESGHA